MKNKKKKYDLTDENITKIRFLNEQYLEYYHDIEKALFKKSKNILKTNILISDILDEMISHQEKKNDPYKLIGANKPLFISKIDKKINYRERLETIRKTDIQNYGISGLWLTMCGYIVLLFIKELLSSHYLIHFYIDSLVAVFALFIALHNFKNEVKIIKKHQLAMKPIHIEIVGFAVSLIVAVFMFRSPFDITFAILVVALLTNKKMFEKEINI